MRRILPLVIVAVVSAAVAFPLGVIASHQFADVPDSNIFHADIDAIADAGVTTGCGGGNYCPSAFVTRDQMAAFMNRLGALQAGKTPVVNADRVDGYQGSDLLAGTAVIPSGMTVVGLANWDWTSVADNQDVVMRITLPGLAPVALDDNHVNWAPDAVATDDDAECTGSWTAPTAPSGKVCIYNAGANLVDGAYGAAAPVAFWQDRVFDVVFFQNGTGSGEDMLLYFVWAYTAP